MINNLIVLYPGLAQLIERVVWDHQAWGLNPQSRTKKKRSILIDTSLFFYLKLIKLFQKHSSRQCFFQFQFKIHSR